MTMIRSQLKSFNNYKLKLTEAKLNDLNNKIIKS